VAEQVVLTPGADEGGRALAARALRELAGRPLEVAVHLAGDGERPALYEHLPLAESVAGQLAVAGAREVPPGEEAGVALLVWGPDPEPRDLWLEPRALSSLDASVRLAPDAWALADEVLGEGRAAEGVGVADARFANGGDVGLLPLLRGAEETGQLSAYAGWNTAGNTLGCALAQLALGGSLATRRERVLEDLAYQGRVRGLLRRWAERELDADVWDLRDPPGARARAEGFLEDRLRQVWLASEPRGPRRGARGRCGSAGSRWRR